MVKKRDGRGHSPNSRKNLVASFEPGNTLSLKHGGYSKQISPLIQEKEKELLALVEGVPYISEVDLILVHNLARVLARLERFDWWLEEQGDFMDKKINPVINVYFTAIETARRYCETLGLSPTARARLGVDLAKYKDIAERLAERAKK